MYWIRNIEYVHGSCHLCAYVRKMCVCARMYVSMYAWYARNASVFCHCRHEQIFALMDTSFWYFFFFFFYGMYYLQSICYIRNRVGGGSQLITSFRCSCLFLIGCSRTFFFCTSLSSSFSVTLSYDDC